MTLARVEYSKKKKMKTPHHFNIQINCYIKRFKLNLNLKDFTTESTCYTAQYEPINYNS